MKLLIVDPDVRAAKLLAEGLRGVGYETTVLSSAEEVQGHIGYAQPDLILSEIRLPGMSGFDLLQELRKRDELAHLAFVFLSTESFIDSKIHGLELQADDYIRKTDRAMDLVGPIEQVLERKRHEKLKADFLRAKESASGSLDATSLVDLLRAIEASEKSGVLTVSSKYDQGVIYFRGGEIIDASAGLLRGAEAVYRLFLAKTGSYLVQFRKVRRANRMGASISYLIKEGLARAEIWRALEAQLPSLDAVVGIDAECLARTLADLPDQANRTLKLLDGKRTIMQLLNEGPEDDLMTLQSLVTLHEYGLLQILSHRPSTSDAFLGEKTLGWFPAAALPEPVKSISESPDAALFQENELDALTPSEAHIPTAEGSRAQESETSVPEPGPHPESPEPRDSQRPSRRRTFPIPLTLSRPEAQVPALSYTVADVREPPISAPGHGWKIIALLSTCLVIGILMWVGMRSQSPALPKEGYVLNRSLEPVSPELTDPRKDGSGDVRPDAPSRTIEQQTQDSTESLPKAAEEETTYKALVKQAMSLRYRNPERAIKMYHRALAIHDNDSSVLGELALLYYAKNDFDRTIEFAARAVTADASNSAAWLALGAARQAQNDKAGAREAYRLCTEHGHGPMVSECRRMIR
ncbi:MAG: response regulator [Myxococcales bacterium]|nr:response regulator [Myxococcales bacterium]MCB9707175.1 response regulator [Myxococcales bacterium]